MLKNILLSALALSLSPVAFAADDTAVKVSCLLADQTNGSVKAIKDVSLARVQDADLFDSESGLSYTVGRTTAGTGKNLSYLLFITISRNGEIVAQTGADFTPGKLFNVMLTTSPTTETITCSGR